jgi:riboflavin synthase
MFTGIVERTLEIVAATDHAGGRRLLLPNVWDDVVLGESIAVNGCCLTVAEIAENRLSFDLIRETLDRTNLGALKGGDIVNIERSLRVGSRIDGHFVQGHVDGVGSLVRKTASAQEWRFVIEAPAALSKYLSSKGSICIDGVSLTVASLRGNEFEVALIPTTLQLTTLSQRDLGWRFNLEFDMIAKQIVTFLELRQTPSSGR